MNEKIRNSISLRVGHHTRNCLLKWSDDGSGIDYLSARDSGAHDCIWCYCESVGDHQTGCQHSFLGPISKEMKFWVVS